MRLFIITLHEVGRRRALVLSGIRLPILSLKMVGALPLSAGHSYLYNSALGLCHLRHLYFTLFEHMYSITKGHLYLYRMAFVLSRLALVLLDLVHVLTRFGVSTVIIGQGSLLFGRSLYLELAFGTCTL